MTIGDAHSEATRPLDARTRTAIVGVASFGALFAVGAGYGWGLRAAISVAVGVLIAVVNLYGLARILGALVGARAAEDPEAGIWGILAVVKVVVLFGGVWILMASHLVDPLGLVVGWGALPVGIALASMFSDRRELAPRGPHEPPYKP